MPRDQMIGKMRNAWGEKNLADLPSSWQVGPIENDGNGGREGGQTALAFLGSSSNPKSVGENA